MTNPEFCEICKEDGHTTRLHNGACWMHGTQSDRNDPTPTTSADSPLAEATAWLRCAKGETPGWSNMPAQPISLIERLLARLRSDEDALNLWRTWLDMKMPDVDLTKAGAEWDSYFTRRQALLERAIAATRKGRNEQTPPIQSEASPRSGTSRNTPSSTPIRQKPSLDTDVGLDAFHEFSEIERIVDRCSREHGGFRHGYPAGFCDDCRKELHALREATCPNCGARTYNGTCYECIRKDNV